ncbi:hypothetical protein GP486_001086 [Trichoglossum hirsutum]|uniref:Uncharacterized protein n=1 Tax=Trichoglossum hirsutum TaxID=265104 RepID=A0A9P8LHN5_9PEZI|nr:hypothetical protein GP486_001086 [Trichoglossum hirsutum]
MDIPPVSRPPPERCLTNAASSSAPPRSSTSSQPQPDARTPEREPQRTVIPATYLLDKFQAAQNVFPNLDLRLPAGWQNLKDAEMQELWEERSQEFGFYSYSKSVLITDEMIRAYDAKLGQNADVDTGCATPLSNPKTPVSETPAREPCSSILPSSPIPPSSSILNDGFESEVPLGSQGPLNVKQKESAMSESAKKGAFVLTLGEPDNISRLPSPSVYSSGSSSTSSTCSVFAPTANGDEEALKNLETTEDGQFVVFSKECKADFLLWWEQTTWYIGTTDDGGRLPQWCSLTRGAPILKNFTRVANRQTGEPRVICSFCGINLAYPRTTGRMPTLVNHLQSKTCREKQPGAVADRSAHAAQPSTVKPDAGSHLPAPSRLEYPAQPPSNDLPSYLAYPTLSGLPSIAPPVFPGRLGDQVHLHGSGLYLRYPALSYPLGHPSFAPPAPLRLEDPHSYGSGAYLPYPAPSGPPGRPGFAPSTPQHMAWSVQEPSLGPTTGAPNAPGLEVRGAAADSASNPSAQRLVSYAAQPSPPLQGVGLGYSAQPTREPAVLKHLVAQPPETLEPTASSPRANKRRSVVDDDFRASIKRARELYMTKYGDNTTLTRKKNKEWGRLDEG